MTRNKVDAWRGQIRLPQPLADWLKGKADANYRTLNAELVEQVRRVKEADEAAKPHGAAQ